MATGERRTVLDVADEWEPRLHAAIVKSLRRVLARVARVMGMTAAAGEPFISIDDLNRIQAEWAMETAGLAEMIVEVFGEGAATVTVASVEGTELVATLSAVRNLAAERMLSLARNRLGHVGDVLWAQARKGLLEGFQQGESIPQLQTRVRRALRVSEHVATAVARTEVISASNAGAFWQAQKLTEAGYGPATKTWLATNDGRTRPDHRAADGQTVQVDQPFIVGGYPLMYPGDPQGPDKEVWNCRCTVIWDVPEGEQIRLQERQAGQLVAAGGEEGPMDWHITKTSAGGRDTWLVVRDDGTEESRHTTGLAAGTRLGELYATAEEQGMEPVHGVLIVEDTRTGDARIWEPNSIVWRDLPLSLAYAPKISEGHDDAVPIGRIDEVWRVGNEIRYRGVVNTADPMGAKAFHEIDTRIVRGISADMDDIGEADMEMIWPEDEMALMPSEIRFSHARLMGGTVLMHPAFQEAYIATGYGFEDEAEDVPEVEVDEEGEEREPVPGLLAGGIVPTGQTVRLEPGDTIVVPRLNPLGSEREVRDFVAAVMRHDGITAGGSYKRPPLAAFQNPGLKEPTPLTMSDDGTRIWGHLALWGTCHIGMTGTCVTPPREDEMSYFMLKDLVTAEGEHVAVGQLTFGTGHAATGLNAAATLAHYDNTGTAVADITCGPDAHGIWFSGAVRPEVTEDLAKQDALRACTLSGDWRRMGSALRLVAVLCVNVPGFPVPRRAARVYGGHQTALVAAGIVTHEVATRTGLDLAADRIAATIGRDWETVAGELAARVHATEG